MNDCCIPGCPKPRRSKNAQYCEMHYARVRRHGNPHTVIAVADRQHKCLDSHPRWIGQGISYNGMHDRVRTAKGSASEYECIDCGSTARHWCYDRTDPDELHTRAGIPYSADVDRYAPRCVPCHKRFDLKAISASGGEAQ